MNSHFPSQLFLARVGTPAIGQADFLVRLLQVCLVLVSESRASQATRSTSIKYYS